MLQNIDTKKLKLLAQASKGIAQTCCEQERSGLRYSNENLSLLWRCAQDWDAMLYLRKEHARNLRYKNGVWTIEKRMQRIGSQSTSDVDASLGPWEEEYYEGVLPAASCLGIRYQFTIRHRSYSGDGTYHLAMTYLEAEKGKDLTFESIGKQLTQRGTSEDSDATVWQLIDDNGKHEANFVYEPMNQTLTLLTKDFKRIESSLDYSLKRKSKR